MWMPFFCTKMIKQRLMFFFISWIIATIQVNNKISILRFQLSVN